MDSDPYIQLSIITAALMIFLNKIVDKTKRYCIRNEHIRDEFNIVLVIGEHKGKPTEVV